MKELTTLLRMQESDAKTIRLMVDFAETHVLDGLPVLVDTEDETLSDANAQLMYDIQISRMNAVRRFLKLDEGSLESNEYAAHPEVLLLDIIKTIDFVTWFAVDGMSPAMERHELLENAYNSVEFFRLYNAQKERVNRVRAVFGMPAETDWII